MVKPTKFRKAAAGGLDKGDASLNGFGMLPIIQESNGVSGFGQSRIGVVPDDGATILEIMTMISTAITGSGSSIPLDFGTSADTSAFGVLQVSGVGRYLLPAKNITTHSGDVQGSGAAFSIASAGQHVLVTVGSASGSTTPPTFICYTTFLQKKTTDF